MKTTGLNDGLVMKNLETYINLVRVTNAIGYQYTMRSNGVTIQETPLLPGKVFDGDIDGYDLNYQPTKSSVSANWNGFGLAPDVIAQIDVESGMHTLVHISIHNAYNIESVNVTCRPHKHFYTT